MADEALANKEQSREALAFMGRLVAIPLITGALISRAVTDPVLSFSLQVSRGAGPRWHSEGTGGLCRCLWHWVCSRHCIWCFVSQGCSWPRGC